MNKLKLLKLISSFCPQIRVRKLEKRLMMLLLHSVVLEAEGVEERGPDCELRQLTNLKVFGDAVLHVVS